MVDFTFLPVLNNVLSHFIDETEVDGGCYFSQIWLLPSIVYLKIFKNLVHIVTTI